MRGWLESKGDLAKAVRWPIAIKGSPFRGLAAFGAKHAPVFFGRSRDITKAVDALKDGAERGTPFLLLIGSSGSGKSSLARAGLAPRLTTPGVVASVDRWRVAVMRPGEKKGEPVLALAQRLFDGPNDIPADEEGRAEALPELGKSPHKTPQLLAKALAGGDAASVVWALDAVAEEAREKEGYDRPVRADLLLVVDQLDELFAADVSEAERDAFAKAVAALVATGRVWVIATLRADLYERFLKRPELLALKTQGATYDVGPPGTTEIDEIIRGPADAAGLVFETNTQTGERLDDRLIADVDKPDMLPLVQFTLDFLFDAAEGRRRRNEADLWPTTRNSEVLPAPSTGRPRLPSRPWARRNRIGCRDSCASSSSLPRRPRLPRRPGSRSAHCHCRKRLPTPLPKRLVRALIDARILLSEGSGESATLRLAHQRVVEDWKRAKKIVAANAEFYRIRNDVEAFRRRWEKNRRKSNLLIPKGVPLAEAESIAKAYPGELPEPTRAFISASRNRARLPQRIGFLLLGIFGLAGAATAAGLYQRADSARAPTQRGKGTGAAAIFSDHGKPTRSTLFT